MKLVFLPSARVDLLWMRRYYTRIFPEGAQQAAAQYARTRNLLRRNPLIGHAADDIEGIREYSIPRMPFSFIYRVGDDRIEVLRVWDERGDRSRLV